MNANKVTLVLFALLLGVRLAYFEQYAALPFLDGPLFDAQVYLAQAQAIAASRYGDPTLLAFSPLYGYMLHFLDGTRNPAAIVLLQHAMSLGTLGLVWHALKRRFGSIAALFCVLLLGGYGFLTFFETKLLSETLGMFLLALALHTYHGPTFQRGSAITCALAGGLFGLATLARASLLFCLPFVALAPYFARAFDSASKRQRLLRATWVSVGIAVVLGCNGLWNFHNAGVFTPVIMVSKTAATSSKAQWSGNLNALKAGGGQASSWDVVEQARRRMSSGESAPPAEATKSSGLLFGVDVLSWAQQFPRRMLATCRDVETSHQYRYYGERKHMSALDAHPVSFGFLSLCAALGLFALWKTKRMRDLHGLWPIIVGTLVTTTLIMPSSRYRLPIVIPLAMMGAIGLSWLWNLRGSSGRLTWLLVAALFVFFAARTRMYEPRHPGLWELTLAEAAFAAGSREEGMRYLQMAADRYGNDSVVTQRARLILGHDHTFR